MNYQDLAELRVSAAGDARTIAARTRAGDRWSVPIAADDVARVQRALDVVDLRLGKAGCGTFPRDAESDRPRGIRVAFFGGQAGVVLVPDCHRNVEAERGGVGRAGRDEHRAGRDRFTRGNELAGR